MKHRSLCLLLAGVFCFLLLPVRASAAQNPFKRTQTAPAFADVPGDAWYSANVTAVCEYGVMNGKGNGRFDPDGFVTYAEGVTLASRLHKLYHEENGDFEQSEPWYQTYEDYAWEHGFGAFLLSLELPMLSYSFFKMNDPLPRAMFAMMISRALPDEALKTRNTVEMGAIPDAPLYARDDIYRLYKAGIITGKDARGTFDPEAYLTRAETAAILSRVTDPSLRQSVTLRAPKASPLTEARVREMIGAKNAETVTRIVLADFDLDGVEEAFVITDGSGSDWSALWFVSGRYADILCASPDRIRFDEEQPYDDFGTMKVICVVGGPEIRNHSEGSGVILYRVENGAAKRLDLPNYRVEEDELFPGINPYMMCPLGSMYFRGLTFVPEKNAYILSTLQVIYIEEALDGNHDPFIRADCLLEWNEEKDQFEWTMRRLDISQAGYYDYDAVKAVLDAGEDGWIPAPAKRIQDGIADW